MTYREISSNKRFSEQLIKLAESNQFDLDMVPSSENDSIVIKLTSKILVSSEKKAKMLEALNDLIVKSYDNCTVFRERIESDAIVIEFCGDPIF